MIKRLFFRFLYKKSLASLASSDVQNQQVLVIIDGDSFEVEEVQQEFKKVFLGSLSPQWLCFTKKPLREKDVPYIAIHKSDFKYTKPYVSDSITWIAHEEFEFVFQLFSKNHIYLNFLSASAKAKIRVGFSDADSQLTDFTLKVEKSELDIFFKELKKYIDIFNKSA